MAARSSEISLSFSLIKLWVSSCTASNSCWRPRRRLPCPNCRARQRCPCSKAMNSALRCCSSFSTATHFSRDVKECCVCSSSATCCYATFHIL
ncbi:hypothetical protein E2C01_026881 [Portunus trituberculatus]|uniref:Secreted protein n=1 Tax=Portunus trituberculatus TaxID=210409 RepID=A0A5B7EK65_PORTR|nr:hypothetical protein [Portunus trituberculatus]